MGEVEAVGLERSTDANIGRIMRRQVWLEQRFLGVPQGERTRKAGWVRSYRAIHVLLQVQILLYRQWGAMEVFLKGGEMMRNPPVLPEDPWVETGVHFLWKTTSPRYNHFTECKKTCAKYRERLQ